MPILPREPDTFPGDLLDQAAPGSASVAPWWAVYTLPRREKQLVRRLREMGIAHYLPLVKRRSRSRSGRVRISHVPLFANYAFVRGE